jgi:ABC-type multidrug transport system fused ATPase/permease subunit
MAAAVSAGDLIGLVAETLEGLPVVTAFNQNKFFIATAANKIDEHHRALFNGESLNLWLAFYCDLYGAILVLAVCIFAVVMRDILGAAAVGLAFSNTIQVGTLCWLGSSWLLVNLPVCCAGCLCFSMLTVPGVPGI